MKKLIHILYTREHDSLVTQYNTSPKRKQAFRKNFFKKRFSSRENIFFEPRSSCSAAQTSEYNSFRRAGRTRKMNRNGFNERMSEERKRYGFFRVRRNCEGIG